MKSVYWRNIITTIKTLTKGLGLTLRHLVSTRNKSGSFSVSEDNYFEKQNGIATLQYPHESMPVPDNGRYRLHNEIDDCIVCDKCAKICPVDCIEIEPVKAKETFGHTSDGTPKRIYAAKFDINMGKCCFCGLCTTVCPTECLTMTKSYDFSEFDIDDHTYSFANMSPADILAKQKEAQESAPKSPASEEQKKPVAKPKMKPKTGGKPVFRPRVPKPKKKDD